MISRPLGLVVLGLSLLAACAPRAEPPATAMQADTVAVNAVREQEITALSTGDTTLAYMADDIVLMPPNEPTVVGVPAARLWFAGMLRQFRVSATYTSSKLVFAGNLAVEHYTGSLTVTPVAGGQPTTEVFKGLHVYRRESGGAWKMVQDIWNSDTAPATGH